jgi:NADH dehydrogenase
MMGLEGLPGVSPVAIQGAKHVAKQIEAEAKGSPARKDFRYVDKGSMATISRFRAVASIGRLHLRGFIAWVAWLALHLLYLTAFKNRITAVMHWGVSFVGRGRAERTATYQQVFARTELAKLHGGALADRASTGAASQPVENLSVPSRSQGPPR